MAEKKNSRSRGLGRGLSSLMADVSSDSGAKDQNRTPKRPDLLVPIEKVFANPDQPRRTFDKEQIEDLAASIKEKGVIQPLIVRLRKGASDEYEIVAGERRWRASQIAKLHEIPVLVREFSDVEVLEVAIIENIQRSDLNPVEEASGYKQLMEKFGHTQEKLSEALGKSRSHIANLMRLLQLPNEVLDYLQSGQLSAGHARALITSSDPVLLAKKVIHGGLSVRETEKLAKQSAENTSPSKAKSKDGAKAVAKDADTKALEGDLSASIGMKVVIDHKPGLESGSLSIHYSSLDELDEICRILSASH